MIARDTKPPVWIVLISGALQREGGETGMSRLADTLDRYAAPGVHIELRAWCDEWKQLARRIAYSCPDGVTPIVIIAGYSYGKGWGAVRLSQELDEYDVPVRHLFSIDGVYRAALYVMMWRSFIPPERPIGHEYTFAGKVRWLASHFAWLLGRAFPLLVPTIRVPGNVREIWILRQRENVPMGHDLVVAGYTRVRQSFKVRLRHEAMDDARVLHQWVEQTVKLAIENR